MAAIREVDQAGGQRILVVQRLVGVVAAFDRLFMEVVVVGHVFPLVCRGRTRRHSRTQRLFEAFGPSMKEADEIVLTDIYAASEEPIAGVTVETLADAIRRGAGRPVHVVAAIDQVVPRLVELARPGDAVITLGAGSIGSLPRKLVEALERREARR